MAGTAVWESAVLGLSFALSAERLINLDSLSGDRMQAKILNALAERRHVIRDGITVNAYLDKWEPAHGRDLKEGSRAVIRHDLRPVRDRLESGSFRALPAMTLKL